MSSRFFFWFVRIVMAVKTKMSQLQNRSEPLLPAQSAEIL